MGRPKESERPSARGRNSTPAVARRVSPCDTPLVSPAIRSYDHATDYQTVSDLLIDVYEPGTTFANWLQPRWEYMHAHEYTKSLPVERFGVAEDRGEVVGIVHFEHNPAFVYLQVHPDAHGVAPDLLDYAIEHLGGYSQTFERDIVGLYINDFDEPLRRFAAARGFERCSDHGETNSRYLLDRPIPDTPLPPGFRIQSLADENDLERIDRVLWRGFGHEGVPLESGPAAREASQQTPGFRKDLTVVAVAPDGAYASYTGMWFVPKNRVAYIEPVATDPDFRRMGLARAAVAETLRRAAGLGAEVAWVGSDLPLYLAMGFTPLFSANLWVRDLER